MQILTKFAFMVLKSRGQGSLFWGQRTFPTVDKMLTFEQCNPTMAQQQQYLQWQCTLVGTQGVFFQVSKGSIPSHKSSSKGEREYVVGCV